MPKRKENVPGGANGASGRSEWNSPTVTAFIATMVKTRNKLSGNLKPQACDLVGCLGISMFGSAMARIAAFEDRSGSKTTSRYCCEHRISDLESRKEFKDISAEAGKTPVQETKPRNSS